MKPLVKIALVTLLVIGVGAHAMPVDDNTKTVKSNAEYMSVTEMYGSGVTGGPGYLTVAQMYGSYSADVASK